MLCCFLPDTAQDGRQNLVHTALNILFGVSGHQDMGKDIQALGAALGAGALAVDDLLDANLQFRPPCIGGLLVVIEDIVDRVCAGASQSAHMSIEIAKHGDDVIVETC